ncbi:FMN-dependent NADH-azoreductase [Pseudoduganella sp. UC29_71]|uniref:FMN-dependent NADH-azoreductase n=1 Tax=Pseudoduganella sp. UC29_71 TaxID=3350174 RepID=UPI00366A61AE
MNILHVSCSPGGQAAESYRLAQHILGALLAQRPAARVLQRAIGGGAVPRVDAVLYSEELIAELEAADALLISTPMHNLTVPAALKAWIDLVVRAQRTFRLTPEGKVGVLRDRPVFIAIASGGRYSGQRARQPDFLTPYLKTILATIGLHDLAFFSVQGTGLGPDAVEQARSEAGREVRDYFAALTFAAGGTLPGLPA